MKYARPFAEAALMAKTETNGAVKRRKQQRQRLARGRAVEASKKNVWREEKSARVSQKFA